MHFLRLLGLWRPGAQSARDIHLLALTLSNIYRLKITDRLSNKRFLIWLLTPPPHLKYVSTLPSNLSLIACFLTLMFRGVMWQHMKGVVGFLITTFQQIYRRVLQ